MKTITRLLFDSAHPASLIIGCGAVMSGLTAAVLRGGISLFPAFLTLLFALLLQISANFFYVYTDMNSVLSGQYGFRVRGIHYPEMSDMSVRLIKVVANGFGILAVTAGLPLFTFIGWIGVAYMAVIILLLYCYFSGPRPLVRTPYSLLFTFLIFGPIAVSGTALIQDTNCRIWLPVVVYSIVSGLMACNAHIAIQYLRLQEDMESGKKTLLIVAGFNVVKYVYLVNTLAVAAVLIFRPCVSGMVSHWLGITLGIGMIASTVVVLFYMGRHSPDYAVRIKNITQGQYVVLIVLMLFIAVCSIEDLKFNLLHLV